ncbi:MAG TPA: ABC transporter permease [Thermoanaerobaculia bacterium]|nr:ABC transporter permease [Thermoanaerobaculia bacterium]
MSGHRAGAPGPLSIAGRLWRERHLVRELTRREVVARYRGSWLGGAWALLEPLLQFALYTFVFAVVFRARWGTGDEGPGEYALQLFAGLSLYNLFAEPAVSAPNLVLSHRHFVRKAVFPLETLPLARFLSASVPALTSLALLLVVLLFLGRGPLTTWLLLPLALVGPVLFSLGAVYFLAAIGVFVRDVGHVVRLAVMAGLFLSPVFYSLDRLPASWQRWLLLNPFSHFVRDLRRVALDGLPPVWLPWAIALAASALLALLAYAWFDRSQRAFADVV